MVIWTISPTERPANLDRLEKTLMGLDKLSYMGPYVDSWFFYDKISGEIQRRLDSVKTFGKSRLEPYEGKNVYREIFLGTPAEAVQLLTSPYPVNVDIHYAPQAWTDGKDIDKQCRLHVTYSIRHIIRLEGETNEYYIAKVPESKELFIASAKGFKLTPELGFMDGIPIPCIDHLPFYEICVPRFREIRKILEESGLPKKIEPTPKLSDILGGENI